MKVKTFLKGVIAWTVVIHLVIFIVFITARYFEWLHGLIV